MFNSVSKFSSLGKGLEKNCDIYIYLKYNYAGPFDVLRR